VAGWVPEPVWTWPLSKIAATVGRNSWNGNREVAEYKEDVRDINRKMESIILILEIETGLIRNNDDYDEIEISISS
jgi:hypothetical protein